MRRLLLVPPLLIVLLCGFLAVSEDSPIVVVNDIRMGVNGSGQTRLVLDLEGRPDYVVGPVGELDQEIVIHLDGGRFAVPGSVEGSGSKKGKGAIDQVFFGPDLVRLSLEQTALPTRIFVLDPTKTVKHHRLVIDLDPASKQAFAEAAAAFKVPLDETPTPDAAVTLAEIQGRRVETTKDRPRGAKGEAPASRLAASDLPVPSLKPTIVREDVRVAELPSLSAPTLADERPLIVLDPGHGGGEPGAIGMARTKEKNVTLSFGKALAKILEKRGYRVMLTRSTDVYVPHGERIQMARDSGADLFMSLHADSHEDHSLRGASVYTLSERRSAKMADELRNTGHFQLFDVEVDNEDGVGDILLDLAQTNTRQNSDRLATSLIESMDSRGIPLLKNPKRRGALLVLLSPDVPAVLVELAFLSNPRDEANLTSSGWRGTSVTAIADGIDDYFDNAGVEARLAGASANSG